MSKILFFCVMHIDVALVLLASYGLVVSGERSGIHPWIYILVSILVLAVIAFAMNLRDDLLIKQGIRIAAKEECGKCVDQCMEAFHKGIAFGRLTVRGNPKNAQSVKKEEAAR